jgi:peroxiredoxin
MLRILSLPVVLLLFSFFGCNERFSASNSSTQNSWQEGRTPPDFELTGIDGRIYKLASFKGKVILVNFWATWCPPCVAEMGSFERVYKELKGEGFELVSVNVDSRDSLSDVRNFIKNNGITFPVLLDPDMKVASSWGLSGFPETFFLSRDGTLLAYFDEEDNVKSTRIVADRPWDNPKYIEEIRNLIRDSGKIR